jgi:hypothetical protein
MYASHIMMYIITSQNDLGISRNNFYEGRGLFPGEKIVRHLLFNYWRSWREQLPE